jgi:hypothetical protein
MAQAGQLLPINSIGGPSTTPIGLSDAGLFNGAYLGPDHHSHAFQGALVVGGPGYVISAYYVLGPNGGEFVGINDSLLQTGYNIFNACPTFRSPSPICYQATTNAEFEFFPHANKTGEILPVTKNGVAMFGSIGGINPAGLFVGSYVTGIVVNNTDTNTGNIGFIGKDAKYLGDLILPFKVQQTFPRAINDDGEVAGYFYDSCNFPRGFILQNNVATVVNYPVTGERGTFLEGVNRRGDVSGRWIDSSGYPHAFWLPVGTNHFMEIKPPHATQAQAWSINKNREIAVSSDVGGFVYCAADGDTACTSNASVTNQVAIATPGPVGSFQGTPGCVLPARGTPVRPAH